LKILIINGPNLNLLGTREPSIYGPQTLKDIEQELRKKHPDVEFSFLQSNHEGMIIDALHATLQQPIDGIILNPGAYTHYSYAIRDAVAAMAVPVIEVHLSNIHLREDFRRNSVIAPVCKAQISGVGAAGYSIAVTMISSHYSKDQTPPTGSRT
jgi:3-dehydroquinate dehydratase-2